LVGGCYEIRSGIELENTSLHTYAYHAGVFFAGLIEMDEESDFFQPAQRAHNKSMGTPKAGPYLSISGFGFFAEERVADSTGRL
jgi:hypothetical protein